MNQQQLDAIKARAEAALPGKGPVDLEKVKAMAHFRKHAAEDVLELVAEVERLRVEVEELSGKLSICEDFITRLTPTPPRQLTPEEIQQRIDDNFFDEEYD